MIPDLYDRKLGLLEILAASWRIYSRNFKILLLFVFLLNFLAYRINYSLVVWNKLKVTLPFWMPASWDIHTLFVPFVTALSTVLVIQIIADSIKGESVKITSIACRSMRSFLPAILLPLHTQVNESRASALNRSNIHHQIYTIQIEMPSSPCLRLPGHLIER